MNAFQSFEAIAEAARHRAEYVAPFGVVRSCNRGSGDALLTGMARNLMSEGLSVHGAIQVNVERGGDRLCDMDVELLHSGQCMRISQSLGAGARGCQINTGELENAVAAITAAFDHNADLLVINKFGKTEAGGGGFRNLIGEALAQGVPVLTCVNAMNLEAFEAFSAGLHVMLNPDHATITNWCKAALVCRRVG